MKKKKKKKKDEEEDGYGKGDWKVFSLVLWTVNVDKHTCPEKERERERERVNMKMF